MVNACVAGTGRAERLDLAEGVNVSMIERWLSLGAGSALAVAGVARRSWAGVAMVLSGAYLAHRGNSGHCLLYQASGVNKGDERSLSVREQFTVQAPRSAVDEVVRDANRYSEFLSGSHLVRVTGPGQVHWVFEIPGGYHATCDARIVEDLPGERLVWETLPDESFQARGEIRLQDAPGGRGTEIHVHVEYRMPGGLVGRMAGKAVRPLFSQAVRENLRRLKQLLEAGEVTTNRMRRPGQIVQQPIAAPAVAAPGPVHAERVAEASAESFPASDPPAWTATAAGRVSP